MAGPKPYSIFRSASVNWSSQPFALLRVLLEAADRDRRHGGVGVGENIVDILPRDSRWW